MDETIRRYCNLVTVPGERYQYSNLGYGLLGYIIYRMSGRSYKTFMRDEVFVPLGMNHTSVHSGPGLEDDQAVKYTPGGSPIPPSDSDSPGSGMIYSSAHDLIRFAMFHLKTDLSDQDAIITNTSIDEMQRPSPETGPMREWEREGSGYGIGWFIGVTEEGQLAVHHSGGTHGVTTDLALIPEENLAVAVLSNTHSRWPEAILIEILHTLMPGKFGNFPAPTGGAADASPFEPDLDLLGSWEGFVHTYEGDIPLVLDVGKTGGIFVMLGEQSRARLQSVSYRTDFPEFKNFGGGPFLRGSMLGELGTDDVNRGRPYKLWLELKLRENSLNGSLIAFSRKKNPTGPLTHWVDLRRR